MKKLLFYLALSFPAVMGAAQKLVLPDEFYTRSDAYPARISDAFIGIPKASFGNYKVTQANKAKEGEKEKDSRTDLFWHTTSVKNRKRLFLQITFSDTARANAECLMKNITEYSGTSLFGNIVGIKDHNNISSASYPMELYVSYKTDTLTWYSGIENYPLSGFVKYKTDSFTTRSLYKAQKRSGKIRNTAYCQGIYLLDQDCIIAAAQFEPRPYVWISTGMAEDKKRMIGFYLATVFSIREPDQ